MNNFLKLAYEAGAQQALIDVGLLKLSEKPGAAPALPAEYPTGEQLARKPVPPPSTVNPVTEAVKKAPVSFTAANRLEKTPHIFSFKGTFP